jgi:hypothetical protein
MASASVAPSGAPRFRTIGGLRGIVAFGVALFHFNSAIVRSASNWLPSWGETIPLNGFLGVEIFFVISGFVIAYSVWDGAYSFRYLGLFALRRSIRLDPPILAHDRPGVRSALLPLSNSFTHSCDLCPASRRRSRISSTHRRFSITTASLTSSGHSTSRFSSISCSSLCSYSGRSTSTICRIALVTPSPSSFSPGCLRCRSTFDIRCGTFHPRNRASRHFSHWLT